MNLTKMQRTAIEKAIEWYYTESYKKQLFVIGGYAGTGKTFIVKLLIEILGLATYNVLFCAYTGKAVNVLRMRGNIAQTIHKSFYQIYNNNSILRFKLKKELPSIVKLIVIDEGSMINNKIVDDILSFKIPVIMLGDPGQLPPIFGRNTYMDEPDVFLTEIMRQKDDNGILELATKARNNEKISFGTHKNTRVISFDKVTDIEKYDIVLCWKNSMRIKMNSLIREKLGFTHIYPSRNEKLVCLNNNYVHEVTYNDIGIVIVNGLNCISLSDVQNIDDEQDTFVLRYKPDFIKENSYYFETRCNKSIFDNIGDISKCNVAEIPQDIVNIDFGYSLTVHKSQGSEWDNVLVINDYGGSNDDYPKWLYTAITRSKKSITIASLY